MARLLERVSQLRLGERKPVTPGARERLSLNLAFLFARALGLGSAFFHRVSAETLAETLFEQAGPGVCQIVASAICCRRRAVAPGVPFGAEARGAM